MSRNLVKKAVIPVAGLGTRFLPATKTVPKELLPIVDRPILLYIVEECVRAGIEDIVLVAGRGKTAIEDFFDTSFELETQLEKTGKLSFLEDLRRIKSLANIISIRQKEALGLGHAVSAAYPIVGQEPFALLLGDEIMVNHDGEAEGIGELIRTYQNLGESVVAVMEVPREDVKKYGIVSYSERRGELYKVADVVEKPSPEEAPSCLALPGRYVFQGQIFEHLKTTKPGKNGEIQLTDGMTALAQKQSLWAQCLSSKRYDAGDRLGYLQANIELGLKNKEIQASLTQYLKELAHQL